MLHFVQSNVSFVFTLFRQPFRHSNSETKLDVEYIACGIFFPGEFGILFFHAGLSLLGIFAPFARGQCQLHSLSRQFVTGSSEHILCCSQILHLVGGGTARMKCRAPETNIRNAARLKVTWLQESRGFFYSSLNHDTFLQCTFARRSCSENTQESDAQGRFCEGKKTRLKVHVVQK